MLIPKTGWVCTYDGRRAVVVHVADTPVLVDGELAARLLLLAAPALKGDAPLLAVCTTADVDVSPSGRPGNVLGPVAVWLGTARTRTADVDAIADAMLTVLGTPAAT